MLRVAKECNWIGFLTFELTGACCAIHKASLRDKDLNPTKKPV